MPEPDLKERALESFEDLTSRGKARRLREVALTALHHYNLDVTRLELVGLFTNAIFRLRVTSGASYAVRVCAPGWRTDTDLRSEVSWLEALVDEPNIPSPVPVRTQTGDAFALVTSPKLAAPSRCVVMSWLPGTPLGQRLNEANLAKMGELFARLHINGAAFSPPPDFTTLTMTSYLARGEPDALFNGDLADVVSGPVREILIETRAVVAQAFADTYADPTGLRVIHNDLWHDNIKVYRGRLQPLDFEDTIWGYPAQDIAMAFQDLMGDVPPSCFESYVAAFRTGYEALLPWPEAWPGQIDTFQAGRMLWVANYVATQEREHLASHLTWLAPQLARFLETGTVRMIDAAP